MRMEIMEKFLPLDYDFSFQPSLEHPHQSCGKENWKKPNPKFNVASELETRVLCEKILDKVKAATNAFKDDLKKEFQELKEKVKRWEKVKASQSKVIVGHYENELTTREEIDENVASQSDEEGISASSKFNAYELTGWVLTRL